MNSFSYLQFIKINNTLVNSGLCKLGLYFKRWGNKRKQALSWLTLHSTSINNNTGSNAFEEVDTLRTPVILALDQKGMIALCDVESSKHIALVPLPFHAGFFLEPIATGDLAENPSLSAPLSRILLDFFMTAGLLILPLST